MIYLKLEGMVLLINVLLLDFNWDKTKILTFAIKESQCYRSTCQDSQEIETFYHIAFIKSNN